MRIPLLAGALALGACSKSSPSKDEPLSPPPADIELKSAGECGDAGVAAVIGNFGYARLIEGLTSATDGNTVEVCPGTWSAAGLAFDAADIEIVSFSGDASDTILQGDGAKRMLSFTNSNVRLANLTLEGGGGVPKRGWAAAIHTIATNLEIESCVFRDHVRGVITMSPRNDEQATLSIVDSQFTHEMTLDKELLLHTVGVDASISGTDFDVTGGGDGILLQRGTLTFDTVTAKGVDVVTESQEAVSVTVTDSAFDDAHLVLVSPDDLTVSVTGSSFTNASEPDLGALHLVSGLDDVLTATITDTSFTSNSGTDGSAILAEAYQNVDANIDLTLDQVTVSNNDDSGTGAAVSIRAFDKVTVSVKDSTVTGNNSVGLAVTGTTHPLATLTSQNTTWSTNTNAVSWEGTAYDFSVDFGCDNDPTASCQ